MTPDPNCSNCNGTGKIAAIALDIHGDGQHDCFCTTYDQGPQHPEDMTREEVNTEILEWREGRLYRGYDRYLAEQVPGLKAEIQRLQAALPTPEHPAADCPQCEGAGTCDPDGEGDRDCPYCHGTGKYPNKPGPDTLAEKRGER